MPAPRRTFNKRIKAHLWWIIALLFTCSMVTGFLGFQEYFSQVKMKTAAEQKVVNLDAFDSLYATFQLIIMDSGGRSASVPEDGTTVPRKLQFARFAVPLFSILALIKLLMIVAQEQVTLVIIRLSYRKHRIICGLGDKGVGLIHKLLEQKPKLKIIAIESNPNNNEIENVRDLGVRVLIGDAADVGILTKAGVEKAEKVYAVTGSDEVNVSIAKSAHDLVCKQQKKRNGTIEFFTHVFDPELTTYIMAHKVFSDPGDRLNARIINTAQVTAQNLLVNDRLNLSYRFQIKNSISPHVLLVGYGVFGEQLLLQIAQYCHYPKGRVRITVIEKMKGCNDNFLNKYDFLKDYIDVEFIEGTGAESLPSDLYKKITIKHPVTAICVCVGNHTEGLEITTILKRMDCFCNQPLVIVSNKSTVQELLKSKDNGHVSAFLNSKKIIFINLVELMCEHLVVNENENDLVSKCIHETYREIRNKEDAQRTGNKPLAINSVDHPERCVWEFLDEGYKESNRNQARDNILKLGIFGFTCEAYPDAEVISVEEFETHVSDFAIMEHNRWMLTKFLDGWKLGAGPDGKKDKTMRLNPDLKKWNDLTEEIKKRNLSIANAMPKYFEAAGKCIYRMKPGNS